MKVIETISTSRSTAGCDPIVLRETDRIRLVFIPTLIDNRANPKASVDGYFVYQRKTVSQRWVPLQTVAVSTLKAGEGFKLSLHADELWNLFDGVVRLYNFYGQQGIPKGSKRFVELDEPLTRFLALGERELATLFEDDPDDAAEMLAHLVKWATISSERGNAAARLASLAPEQMPAFSALLGLASLKEALAYWQDNQSNNSEEFWQTALSDRAFVLSQTFAYPIILIGKKAYVGGKQISNTGGNIVDFLGATESTAAAVLIEIKTPQTQLLGSEYRSNVYPLSTEITGAIAQVLKYRRNLISNFQQIADESSRHLTIAEPRCLVIAGNARNELKTSAMREGFELQRERLQGVTILAYDELFSKLASIVKLVEGEEMQEAPRKSRPATAKRITRSE
jgi:hypothetical protein